jgi:hypothetical protein
MTPRDVDALSPAEFAAFHRYMAAELRELDRQHRRAQRGR